MTEEKMEAKKSNKGLLLGGLLLVLLLVGAAFVGGQLLKQGEAETAVPDLPPGMVLDAEEGANLQTFDLSNIKPAAELPARVPDERGLYVSRADDTITIGTGNVMAMLTEQSETPEFSYDGIAVEVLVTNQTALYEDITQFTPGQTTEVQQEIRPLDNLDDLDESTTLQVWGRREGDRIIAETIVLLKPPPLPQP
jgi:hypothetical protein